uniref:Uncharacterized protein n=1 Tax=Arundo donax TaxID=35708 RepID=A0A0A9DKP9_ARUDO
MLIWLLYVRQRSLLQRTGNLVSTVCQHIQRWPPRCKNDVTSMNLVPAPFRGAGVGNGNRPGLVHTFGFDTEHDAAAMHTIGLPGGGMHRRDVRAPGRRACPQGQVRPR